MSFFEIGKKGGARRIFLDYAAGAPVDREVFGAMEPYFSEVAANPSGIYKEGVAARKAIEDARLELARVLKVREHGVVFTSCGSESNNLALYGSVRHLHEKESVHFKDIEIISTKIEHPSVLNVLSHLEDIGVTVHYAKLDEEGRIDKEDFKKKLSPKTRLCTFAYANSEIGVVEDVKKLTRIVRLYSEKNKTAIKVHLDASQAALWLPCQLDMLGVDLMTLDAGKCYGPKGVGVLAFRHGIELMGILLGGEQEFGLRAGTENTPLIVGCVRSMVKAQAEHEELAEKTSELRDYFIGELEKQIEGVKLNGPREGRTPNNVNVSIEGVEGEFAVVTLDEKGIAASTRSACSGSQGGSAVVRELFNDDERAIGSIRFSLGKETKKADLDYVTDVLKEHAEKVRTFTKTLER